MIDFYIKVKNHKTFNLQALGLVEKFLEMTQKPVFKKKTKINWTSSKFFLMTLLRE